MRTRTTLRVSDLDRFVIGTKVKPDENLMSFIVRLGVRRGLGTARVLAQAGLTQKQCVVPAEKLERLARLADVSLDQLAAISYGTRNGRTLLFRGIPVDATHFKNSRYRRRVCPDCLGESLHYRAIWDLGFFEVCPIHRRVLISNCPECRAPLTWRCDDLAECRCGQCDLAKVPEAPEQVDDRLADAIAVAAGLLGDERFATQAARATRFAPLSDMEPINAFDFLCRYSSALAEGYKAKFSIRAVVDGALPLVAGLTGLANWPGPFMEPGHKQAFSQGRPVPRIGILVNFRDAVVTWLDGLPEGQGKVVRDFVARDPLGLAGAVVKSRRSRFKPDAWRDG